MRSNEASSTGDANFELGLRPIRLERILGKLRDLCELASDTRISHVDAQLPDTGAPNMGSLCLLLGLNARTCFSQRKVTHIGAAVAATLRLEGTHMLHLPRYLLWTCSPTQSWDVPLTIDRINALS